MINYAEAHISTEQSSPRQDARLQDSHGDQERSSGAEETPRQGAQTPDAIPLLKPSRHHLPQSSRLRNAAEFRSIYNTGRRYDGSLMTAFLRPNGLKGQRLGITASRKMARSAVERNRAKRLLREAFRLSSAELKELRANYDWVLNARRSLLKVKVSVPLKEFQAIIARVSRDESDFPSDANSGKSDG